MSLNHPFVSCLWPAIGRSERYPSPQESTMSDRAKRPVLLNQAAKIVRRRRTADEAGFAVPNFDAGDAPPRFPKVLRRDMPGRKEKLAEVKEVEKESAPSNDQFPFKRTHRPLTHQSSIRLPTAATETAVACDWPMSGKEKAHPNHVIRRIDIANGMNVSFPLVYDISQTMDVDQIIDGNGVDSLMGDTESCQLPTDGAQFDFNAVLSQLRNYQQGTSDGSRAIDPSAIQTAMSAFSNLTVSERKYAVAGKNKKRPVYLLIIFASFDSEHRLKCDAYITCVNRIPTGRSEQRLGLDWIMSQLIEMFEQQQAAAGSFSGYQKWMLACCLVETLTHNPRFLTVNAYWRNGREGHQIPPPELLRQIANHPNIMNGLRGGADLATLAINAANRWALGHNEKSMLEFGHGCHTSVITNDRLYQSLAMMTMISRGACWLIEEFNRLNVQQLTAPSSPDRRLS